KRDSFADMLDTGDPGHRALHAKAESRVRDGAKAPEVEVPGIVGFFKTVLGDAALEHVGALLALAAADDLAVALGCDEIATERIAARAGHAGTAYAVGLLEIEGLDLRRHVMDPHRLLVELLA